MGFYIRDRAAVPKPRSGFLRGYDPGRWVSNDPIGISGGLNEYVFCGNDPVTGLDPFGLVNLELHGHGLTSDRCKLYNPSDRITVVAEGNPEERILWRLGRDLVMDAGRQGSGLTLRQIGERCREVAYEQVDKAVPRFAHRFCTTRRSPRPQGACGAK